MDDAGVDLFQCGHVIPKENLSTIVLGNGPTGKNSFEFTYENRDNLELLDELGQTLVSLSTIIPDGMVVFFASYSTMEAILAHWKRPKNKGDISLYQRLQRKKHLFEEPRIARDVDTVLQTYSSAIVSTPKDAVNTGGSATGATATPKGAILFSVVGGKMSEGINFSDRLGRAVVMVGLPFPNRHSVELTEKMKYIDEQHRLNGEPSKDLPTGQEYYENLCMRAVNQSIGRAIRHRNDYACVYLLDRRYGTARIKNKLPQWMQPSIVDLSQQSPSSAFSAAIRTTNLFFKGKRKLEES